MLDGFQDTFGRMEDREKLRQHFENVAPGEQTGKWDGAWKQGITPWDRQAPNPAFDDALSQQTAILGSPIKDPATGERKRALVPGCGRGYVSVRGTLHLIREQF